jgi:hypothetical protein
VKVKPPKDYTFRQKIWELVDKCCEEGQVPDCRPPTHALPSNRVTIGKVRLSKCRENANFYRRRPWCPAT